MGYYVSMVSGKDGAVLLLEPGTLEARVRERSDLALASGALQPIPTTVEFLEEGGIRFLVRVLSSLVRKDEARWQKERAAASGKKNDPFSPCEKEMFVAELTATHFCLLNKFNVVPHHLLIVTRNFEDQESYLTPEDFTAMLIGLREYEGLAFYNGGVIAGASERHKHLQQVPLPLAAEGPTIPVAPALGGARFRGKTGMVPAFPFRHAFGRLDPSWVDSPFEASRELFTLYGDLLVACGLEKNSPVAGSFQSGPYNLLATREWMLIVPRKQEFFERTSVNSLGFAGALLVRNEQERELLRKRGPLTALRSVAFGD